MRITILAATALGFVLASSAAIAATATTNLTVTATVVDTCVVSATAIAFASLNASASTDEATPGAITVTCTSGKTGVTVALGAGENESAGQRRMDDSFGNFVPYAIHSDAGHNTEVGVNGNIYNGNIAAATPTTIDVFGQVPSGSYTAGGYTDTVLITVTYP